MYEPIRFKTIALSSLFLMLVGWGGLYYIVTETLPYVSPRWAFFVLILMAITGTALPIVYLFHRRFPGEKPEEANVIVRQALWFGIYAATLAWLQLGRMVCDLCGCRPGSRALCDRIPDTPARKSALEAARPLR